MVAACTTAHRVQGVGFERVALWIPLRGFFAQGQGYTAASRAQSLKGLFLVLPDTVVQNRDEVKPFLKDAFQPPLDAIKALDDMRARAPATVEADTGGGNFRYPAVWNSNKPSLSPALWTGVWTTIAQPQGTYALNS